MPVWQNLEKSEEKPKEVSLESVPKDESLENTKISLGKLFPKEWTYNESKKINLKTVKHT